MKAKIMRRILKIQSLIILFLTWLGLFLTLSFFIELVFAPWDTAIRQPPIGTWERILNDFFSVYGGNMLLAALLVLASVWAVRKTLDRKQWKIHQFLLNNLLLGVGLFPLMTLFYALNHRLFPYPPVSYDPNYIGYHLAIIPAVALISLITLWLRVNLQITSDTRKRKNHAVQHDMQEKIDRLVETTEEHTELEHEPLNELNSSLS